MYSYDFTSYNSSMIYKGKGRSNMINTGNSCYFNASVSALVNCLGFTHFFISNEYVKVLGPANMEKQEFNYLMKYIKLLVTLFEKNQTISPKSTYTILPSFAPQLIRGEQNDAHECFLALLNILHIANSVKLTKYYIGPPETRIHSHLVNSKKSWVEHFKDDYSIVNELFFGQYIQRLRCNDCNHTSYNYEPFVDLSLPVHKQGKDSIVTIYDLLGDNFRKQVVDLVCEGKCNSKTKFTKKNKIIKTPKYLTIHLKRFLNNGEKINTHVVYSSELELSKYSSIVQNQSVEYNLISVINHTGTSTDGHYYTFNKLSDGEWVNIDDGSTTSIQPIEVCSKNAYVLVYELNAI